jgi:hypothetical protein
MRSSIRIPEGWGTIDMRDEDVALPQEALRNSIACTPANWRDIYGRAVYRDERGNLFALERREGRPSDGRYACVYLVHPVETEEDEEHEPFIHYKDDIDDGRPDYD